MAKKRVKKPIPKAKKAVRLEKYESSYAVQVGVLISKIPLNRKGKLAFGVIAKALGVGVSTMLKWRTPGDKLFKPDFLAAIEVAEDQLRKKIALQLESVELGKINRGVVKRAQGYKKKKIIKEPVTTGPAHPPYSRFSKDDLIAYSKSVGLRLKFAKKDKKGAIEIAIRKRIEQLQIKELAIVRTEEEFIPSDTTAAKYANQNMGKTEERWTDIQNVDVESQSLADILAKTGILNKK